MGNIHVLPTKLASEYFINKEGILSESYSSKRDGAVHFYITNDEEIKEGDYKYNELGIGSISKTTKENIDGIKRDEKKGYTNHLYNIILTTDQDLIKEGVQEIGDKFLEWFLKNPSCEEVEVIKTAPIRPFGSLYKIIIPKEEPKLETVEEYFLDNIKNMLQFNNDALAIRFMEKYFHAKKEQERLYDDEELIQTLIKFNQEIYEVEDVREWFKKFKNK